MSYLISCQNITKSFGAKPLISDLTFGISDNDHIGMIGPNGSGKSTLLKILAGLEEADKGDVARSKNLRLAYLSQQDPFTGNETIQSALMEALKDFHYEDYERETEIAIMMSKVGFDNPDTLVKTLSGGWKKRLTIACQLIRKPDLLLLDEPTNHLDVEGILWLEKILAKARFAYLVVSHDRFFLQNISSRVIELNRRYPEGHFSAVGKYAEFLVKREEFFANQLKQQQTLSNVVKREIEWLRRGPPARTTKASARIKGAHAMIEDLGEMKSRNAQTRTAAIDFAASERGTKRLLVAKDLKIVRGDRTLVENLTLTLGPGMRLGLLGLNGSGKTSLIQTLVGNLPPAGGSLEHAPHLRTVFLDQNRVGLKDSLTLKQALSPQGDQIIYRDRAIHVVSWAKRFLFEPDQLSLPIGSLSGGERARILIARMMQQSADLLILDEPTNDLDIPTLEVLEESLVDFPGALLLVTHDRYLLNRVSTHLLALDGKGEAEFYADYGQWEAAQEVGLKASFKEKTVKVSEKAESNKPRRLTYKEQKEWDEMEKKILEKEQLMEKCQNENDYTGLKTAQDLLETLYKRWAELEKIRK
ncbi:MAG: ABC-F family ATP-binding cassette domain-containing protein [Deltaproteobacteria bacterium]|nr:ABC-F family ATP-binding cassette domain-containing protein [Deltaproteobacteria bacterium]